jgi:hypothetical protein
VLAAVTRKSFFLSHRQADGYSDKADAYSAHNPGARRRVSGLRGKFGVITQRFTKGESPFVAPGPLYKWRIERFDWLDSVFVVSVAL